MMIRKKILRMVIGILGGTAMMLSVAGCTNNIDEIVYNITDLIDDDSAKAGGTTDKSDPNAPKEIQSKDITQFSSDIYLCGEWGENYDGQYFDFRIMEDENGELMASEYETGAEFPADEELLTSLQDMIDKYDLAKENGVYRVTAGLPPEFQKISFSADYASGEKISFTINNDPNDDWEMALYKIFSDWFDKNGITALNEPNGKSKITSIDIRFKDNEKQILYDYAEVIVKEEDAIDGKTVLLKKYVYDMKKQETVKEGYVRIPDDFYDNVNGIANSYDLRPFTPGSVLYGFGRETTKTVEEEQSSGSVHLRIEFEGDKKISLDSEKDCDIEMLKPMLYSLIEYYDSISEEEQTEEQAEEQTEEQAED